MAQWLAYLLPDPAAPGLLPRGPKNFQRKIVVMAENNHLRCLEEGVQ